MSKPTLPDNAWPVLTAIAQRLSEEGQLVTQIHCRAEDAPNTWAYGDNTAHVFLGAKEDMVVTTDGVTHSLEAAQ